MAKSLDAAKGMLEECLAYFETLYDQKRDNPGHDLVSMRIDADHPQTTVVRLDAVNDVIVS